MNMMRTLIITAQDVTNYMYHQMQSVQNRGHQLKRLLNAQRCAMEIQNVCPLSTNSRVFDKLLTLVGVP